MKGIKFDDGKLRHDLLPNPPIDEVIRVLMHGAEKYEDNNWKIVDNWRTRYYNSAKRHINAWWDGERFDVGEKGSGLQHLAHAICCLIFIMENEREANYYNIYRKKGDEKSIMPYGLTPKQLVHLSDRLSDILKIDHTKVETALNIITVEEVDRIAKNEKEVGE